MTPSLYIDLPTPVHRLDPRTKIIATCCFFAMAMAFNHPLFVSGVFALLLAIAALSHAAGNLYRARGLLVLILVFSSLLWPLFVRGKTPLLALGPFQVSRESLLYGVALGLRLDTMVGAGIVLVSTTMIEEAALGLRRLGLPFAFSFAFTSAFRLVPTLMGSGATVLQAQRSRGLDLESGSLPARIRKHIPLLVPIFVCAIRNADLMAMALESKGFGSRGRTEFLQVRMRAADWLALALLLACLSACLYLRGRGLGAVLPRL